MANSNVLASAVVFSCQWEDVTATPGRNGIISPVLAAKKGLRGYASIGPLATAPSRKVLSTMFWRHLCLVTGRLAAGLLSGVTLIGADP